MLDRYKNDFFKLDYDCILTEDVKQNNRKKKWERDWEKEEFWRLALP